MNQPPVHALFDPRKLGQAWPQPATWPGIPYVQGLSGLGTVITPSMDNYKALQACLSSGSQESLECAQFGMNIGASNPLALECSARTLENMGLANRPNDPVSYCFSRTGMQPCLDAVVSACPGDFQKVSKSTWKPSPPGMKKAPKKQVPTTPAAASETNWLLWGGVAVVAAFFLLRKK